ncbi:MAG TPA: hypothetical protein ENI23_11530 [bacterium]|nr:hypothetical protein [bacterium]
MPIVFNVSRDGVDADTTDRNKLVVTSLDTELKIIKKNSGTVSVGAGDSDATLKQHHGLGYAPAFLSYFEYPDDLGRYWLSGTGLGTAGLSAYRSQSAVTNDLIELTANRSDAGPGAFSQNFAYYLFDQPAGMAPSGSGKPIGYQESAQGIIVSKEGFDADKAKIYEQQFNSNTDYLKYHLTIPGKIVFDTTNDGEAIEIITHNLGYIPIFKVYAKAPTKSVYNPLPIGRVPQSFFSSAGADKTNITINIGWVGGGGPGSVFPYRVVIFKNKMVI